MTDRISHIMNDQREFYGEKQKRWDSYFHKICEAVADKSPCLSRQIGALLVRDYSIVATGYNGPARGYKHCDAVEVPKDLWSELKSHYACPRRAKGHISGEGLYRCPAGHAEANCISNAARLGISVTGATLYMNCIIPCKDCAIQLVNTGVVEVVVDELEPYHTMSVDVFAAGVVKVRRFRV